MKPNISLPLTGFVTGMIFGLGLSVSQMTNPEKVLGFLNVLGDWDPSLLLTMLGAVVVSTVGYQFVLHKGPVFADTLHAPTKQDIDWQLLTGALIFGSGWGLAGYCPGPAITGIASGLTETLYFVMAMLVGSQLEQLWLLRKNGRANPDAAS